MKLQTIGVKLKQLRKKKIQIFPEKLYEEIENLLVYKMRPNIETMIKKILGLIQEKVHKEIEHEYFTIHLSRYIRQSIIYRENPDYTMQLDKNIHEFLDLHKFTL